MKEKTLEIEELKRSYKLSAYYVLLLQILASVEESGLTYEEFKLEVMSK